MMNVMEINGVRAVIAFDPDINMFRGEFVGLNGGADFYATDIEGLHREGEASLKVFFEMCTEEGVSPYKKVSGRFNLRLPQDLHDKALTLAKASGKSVNAWIADVISQADEVTAH
ncbi:MAG: type II toxin-antitoxin system HicB family antitoxin [Desulfuromonadales bacterium]|nr:type II toxin-antitoxin system HicB family antitoxin [Desulfuromonadales bacterium]